MRGFALNPRDDAAIKMPMNRAVLMWAAVASGGCALIALAGDAMAGPHDALITKHASTYGVPEKLVRRVIHIESKGNPRVISKGNYGLMQIRLGTAHSMGYRGTAEGLLDADTNMTYAVKYLASAYRAAGCSEDRAVAYYQRGFYKKEQSRCAVSPSANVQVASKDAAPAREYAVQRSAERDAPPPPDVLRPKVVQVETFSRPKNPNAAPSSVQLAAAPAAVAPVAPVTPVAPVAVPLPVAAPEARSPDVQLPLSPPLPVAAKRPDRTPPQTTMAKAAEPEDAWPPAVPPKPSLLSMQPMPKPRPAKAPKASEVQMAKLDDPDAVPLPQPKPEVADTPERESKSSRRASHRHVRYSRKRDEKPALIVFLEKLTTPTKPQRRRR
jgi:hypothetical protein